MRVEVDGVEIDPQTCTRSNGWRTAGERIKKTGGDAVGLPPAPGNNSERAKATPCRPPINKGKLLKRARMPELPRGDMKIIVRPRGGLRVGDVTRVELCRALTAAAQIAAEDSREDVVCPNSHQNILVISTPRRENADRYTSVERIDVRGTTHEVCAYEAAPHGTVKGVIRDIPLEDTAQDIQEQVVQDYNPTALQANRIGRSRSVVIAFAGLKVPRYIRYGNLLMECTLYRKQIEACHACGRLGHRMDVCPDPKNKICRGCGVARPAEDHTCEPKCGLCGGNHLTADRVCKAKYKTPYIVRQRRWQRRHQDQQQRGCSRDCRGPAGGPQRSGRSRSKTPARSADGRQRSRSRSKYRLRGGAGGRQGRSRSKSTKSSSRRWETAERAEPITLSVSRRRNGPGNEEVPSRAERSGSQGGPGHQRGPADTKVGRASGSPKTRTFDNEFPPLTSPTTPTQTTPKENAEIVELKQIITRQNAQIQEQNAQIRNLMNKIEQLVAKSGQATTNGQEGTAAVAEGPRKIPRRKSPPPTNDKTPEQPDQTQEAMEAEEAPANKQIAQPPKAAEQMQLTQGESAILTALGRIEDRLNTLEAKHERQVSRVAAIEVRMKSASLKRDRSERIKEAIAKRRGRLDMINKDEAENKQEQ